jgi:hypothetical protein
MSSKLNNFVDKIQEILDKNFHSIFNSSHFFYTIIFLVFLLLISLFSFIPLPYGGNIVLFLVTLLSITFLLFMIEGKIPSLDKYLFSTEKKFDRRKGIYFLINIVISLIIVIPYFVIGSSDQMTIQFLGWDVVLPIMFLAIYFGWNLVQILYLRIGFENISENVDNKLEVKHGSSKGKERICLICLVFAIIIPSLIQVLILLGYWSSFFPQGGGSSDPFVIFLGYNLFIFFLIGISSWRLFTLYLKSKKNETPNAFSSVFFILLWIITWFRSFIFIRTYYNIIQNTPEVDVVTSIIDVILMVITSIIVLRGLGNKVYDSILFNKNNMPFFLFAFTLLYFAGQVILITGAGTLTGIFADQKQISLINNFLIIVISVIFYWFYSENVLEKKGLIIKKHFFVEDVVLMITDFKQALIEQDALDTNKFGKDELDNFLSLHHLSIPESEPLEIKPEVLVDSVDVSEPTIDQKLDTDDPRENN